MTTSSPGFQRVTPSPTFQTIPEASEPPMWCSSWWERNTDTGLPSAAHTLLKFTPAAITRTITSNAPGSGSSISSSWKASFGSPSRSWRITHAAIDSGNSPGSRSSFETSDTSTATLLLSGSDRDGNRAHPNDAAQPYPRWTDFGAYVAKSHHRPPVSFPSEATTTFESPMEASEKPQLPLDVPDADGIVRALDDRLVIERLTVADERAARVVRERAEAGQSRSETVTKAIEIGARVLDSEETAANVDYVRHELEQGVGKLNQELAGTIEAGNEELAERIAAAFGADRSDSVQRQIAELARKANEEQRLAMARLF